MFGPCFVFLVQSVLSSLGIILMGETLFVFLISCDRKCSVTLPHGAVGWSAVCACGSS